MKDVMTKHHKDKIIEQRQLVRKPELDRFGYTAIEEKLGCTSVESYVSHPDFATDLPQFSSNQGLVDDTEAEEIN